MRQTLVSLLSAASLMVGCLDVLWTNLPAAAVQMLVFHCVPFAPPRPSSA